jgi:hypothetical protein
VLFLVCFRSVLLGRFTLGKLERSLRKDSAVHMMLASCDPFKVGEMDTTYFLTKR